MGFGLVLQVMYLTGIVYCAYGILRGTVSYGTLTAIMHLIGQVQRPLAGLSGILPRWYAMTASAERLMEIERFAEDDMRSNPSETLAYYTGRFRELRLRGVSFTYRPAGGEKPPAVLEGLDLTQERFYCVHRAQRLREDHCPEASDVSVPRRRGRASAR